MQWMLWTGRESRKQLWVFLKKRAGKWFLGKMGFTTREDLVYRNKNIHELERIDT